MFTVQVHRYEGPDEDFEADSLEQAEEIAFDEGRDDHVRRILIVAPSGSIVSDSAGGVLR